MCIMSTTIHLAPDEVHVVVVMEVGAVVSHSHIIRVVKRPDRLQLACQLL